MQEKLVSFSATCMSEAEDQKQRKKKRPNKNINNNNIRDIVEATSL